MVKSFILQHVFIQKNTNVYHTVSTLEIILDLLLLLRHLAILIFTFISRKKIFTQSLCKDFRISLRNTYSSNHSPVTLVLGKKNAMEKCLQHRRQQDQDPTDLAPIPVSKPWKSCENPNYFSVTLFLLKFIADFVQIWMDCLPSIGIKRTQRSLMMSWASQSRSNSVQPLNLCARYKQISVAIIILLQFSKKAAMVIS